MSEQADITKDTNPKPAKKAAEPTKAAPAKKAAKKSPAQVVGAKAIVPPDEKVEEGAVKKVIEGSAKKRKVPLMERVKTSFISGELKGVARYLGGEVLLPALRNMVVDFTTQGIERMIYGETRSGPRRPANNYGRVQYNNPVSRGTPPSQQRQSARPMSGRKHRAEQIILGSRQDALLALETLSEMIDQYEVASVADLYQLLGEDYSWLDNKWGWTNVSSGSVRQVKEGFLLALPDVEEIEA